MNTYRLAIFIAVILGLSGCATRYAQVYVRTVDLHQGNQPVGDFRVLDAATGIVLGSSLVAIPLQKTSTERAPYLSILVERDQYQREWKLVRVKNWARTRRQAFDPECVNEVFVEVHAISAR